MGAVMTWGAAARARQTSPWRRQGLWWLLSGVVLLILIQLLGVAPPILEYLAPGLGQDLAMMFGLLSGTALASLLLGRAPSSQDTSLRDTGTGLLMPRFADETAETLIARDARVGESRVVLVVIVLGDAEALVRRYGKGLLERLLALIADTLKSQCRGADLPFRLSSRELAVYLHCDGLEQAEAFGRRIDMLLSSQQLDWQGDVLKPTVKMGFAAHKPGLRLEDLRAAARQPLAAL